MLIAICGTGKALKKFWREVIEKEFPEASQVVICKDTSLANDYHYITALDSQSKPPVGLAYYSYCKPAANRTYLLNVKRERVKFLNKIEEVYNGKLKQRS